MKELTIQQLADQLQKKIDVKLKSFAEHHDKLKEIQEQAEELEKKMITVIEELQPVESLIYHQNPNLEQIFESLKRVYGKEQDGKNN